jgi:exfoliative toxin A/B
MACAANMGNPLPWLQYIVLIETIIAVVLVAYTYIRFVAFLFANNK